VTTKLAAEQDNAEDLLELLHAKREFSHLRVRRRGGVLTIESGPKDDAVLHARLRRVTKHLWTLEVATHMGAWQPSGLRAALPDLVRTLQDQFPWVLAPVA
jgi:hypothetical protein